MCLVGAWGVTLPIFQKLQESWSKVRHAAREMATVCFVTFFISNGIRLLLVARQMNKTPPPPTESVSAHLCWEVLDTFWNYSAKAMGEVY